MIKDLITLLADGLVDSSAEQETRELHACLTTLAQAVEENVVVEDYIARLRSLMERVDQQTCSDDAVAIFLTEAPCWAGPPVMVTNATLAAVSGLLEFVVSMVPSGAANNSEAGAATPMLNLGEGVAVGVGRCLPECGSQAMMLVMGLCKRLPASARQDVEGIAAVVDATRHVHNLLAKLDDARLITEKQRSAP